MNNIVAIVGRPNVGKSTFFNRLVGERQAIIDDTSGVTRDRQYGVSDWNGKTFNIVDTGGFVQGSDDIFEAAIRSQVHLAIEEAAIIVFMVDVSTGITDLDDEVAGLLRRSGTGDLLDAVVEELPEETEDTDELPKFAILGQPNVGKSSLLNALVGKERNIVTDIAGTTRDSTHTEYSKFGKRFCWSIPPVFVKNRASMKIWSSTPSCVPSKPSKNAMCAS
ncbi:unnamed protein product [Cyprideis torosa]|uniref:G domain-containing protein n=1 Tax=Cyprideis torosa TaxID=163714 RepID=A0A7R8X0M9_9CRUS|nr:unnamed protein product [Cyprideis torosa]CAG0909893.1 unnamed protein product [Cyprideis torosa]